MKRTLATIALAATLVTASASTANAKPVLSDRTAVAMCTTALLKAHRTPSYEDTAVQVCGLTIRTERQAAALYRWARSHRWALDLIG